MWSDACHQLLELARVLLMLEGGVQRVENEQKRRLAILTRRSVHAKRAQQEQQVVQAADAAATPAQVAAKEGLVAAEIGEGGGGEVSEEVTVEEDEMTKPQDYMSIFELDEDEDEEEEEGSGEGVVLQFGDDEGLLSFTPSPDMGEDGTLVEGDSREVRNEGGRAAFVELTRRILDDLDDANVSG